MSYSLEEKVKWFAIYSRLTIITLQFIFNHLVTDHDAGVFKKPLNSNVTTTAADEIIDNLLGGFTRWDAQYFLHIAEYGYTYENTLAFFPLFPLSVRFISRLLLSIINVFLGSVPFISMHGMLILISVIFNNVLFVKTSVLLYKLSNKLLQDEKVAYISAILFCINPASIFFSAAYSESLYCFIAFYSMKASPFLSFILIGLSGITRSNGIINIGFIVYKNLVSHVQPFLMKAITFMGICIGLMPFVCYQAYCYAQFCTPQNNTLPTFIYAHAKMNHFVLPASSSRWCNNLIPLAYSYVQDHYWNVGYLKYYQWKQVPNFLLAAPIVFIVLRGVVQYFKVLSREVFVQNAPEDRAPDPRRNYIFCHRYPFSIFPHVVQCAALTAFGVLMMHVQVTTRLLCSSSPVPYWVCALAMTDSVKETIESAVLKKIVKKDVDYYYETAANKKSKWKTFILTENLHGFPLFIKYYFIFFFLVGTLMFSNHLPWT